MGNTLAARTAFARVHVLPLPGGAVYSPSSPWLKAALEHSTTRIRFIPQI